MAGLLVNLVKVTVNGPRPEVHVNDGGKTAGRLVWSFCGADISSWRSTGLFYCSYNATTMTCGLYGMTLIATNLRDAFYKVISDTETTDCPVTRDLPAYQCNRANVTLNSSLDRTSIFCKRG